MRMHQRIAAGTALALLMGTAQIAAAPLSPNLFGTGGKAGSALPLILVQEGEQECPADDPDCEPAAQEEAPPAEEAPAEEPPAEEPPAEAPPAEEPPVEEAPAEAPPAEEAPAEAPAEEPAEAPATQEAPAEAPAAEEAPAEAPPAEEAPIEAPAAEEAPAEAPAAEEAPAEAPAAEEPAAEEAPADEPAAEEAPVEEAPAEAPAAEEAPAEEPVTEEAPAAEEAPAEEAPDAQEAPAEEVPLESIIEQPASEAPPPLEEVEGEPLPENAAPVLDSAKEAEELQQEGVAEGEQPVQQQAAPAEEAGPPPTSDAEAQSLEEQIEVQPLRAEEGRRVERDEVIGRVERYEGSELVTTIGGLALLAIGTQLLVQSDDRERLSRQAEDVYYEELPRGRYRETIERPDGSLVVTIYDRYGDVVRRSRVTPDGREYVLVYADDRGWGENDGRRQWRDPGRDLPPLNLTIPVNQYILDAGRVENPDIYYNFLSQPPVERLRRTYSVDEVRYSARVRDSVRRVDLDTVTFDFGSASIGESEIPRLQGVAEAMDRLLERNPAEMFLIEGHTDAVGSDQANLALSHRRAESIADALTNVFAIPPENLVTQGYGERYLKIETQDPERLNRRVAIRRITPLVTPVASAN